MRISELLRVYRLVHAGLLDQRLDTTLTAQEPADVGADHLADLVGVSVTRIDSGTRQRS
ncbi:hypothetical protein OG889_43405 [Streptomyces sp. NBC_00481]|uniref:hypothetical protein n=1 Tax=unclassified Streptomyces TaxID=2593676 RepID=UPI002DD7DEC3|nr:hypothetical protein [Streptomyces sp. NBC_00481]WRZ00932.1 hypothetical protein OG889_43405 [Streptomyces sp. NBC_00481]